MTPFSPPFAAGMGRIVLPLAVATIGLLARSGVAQDLLVTCAWIVDPEARAIRDGNILAREGRIAGFPVSPPADFPGLRFDAGGRSVAPGLSDLHRHSFGNSAVG
jgi:cytosine/adenosine deaminase-related metal-dependent hydrolase